MEKKDFSTERQNFLGGIVVGNRIESVKQKQEEQPEEMQVKEVTSILKERKNTLETNRKVNEYIRDTRKYSRDHTLTREQVNLLRKAIVRKAGRGDTKEDINFFIQYCLKSKNIEQAISLINELGKETSTIIAPRRKQLLQDLNYAQRINKAVSYLHYLETDYYDGRVGTNEIAKMVGLSEIEVIRIYKEIKQGIDPLARLKERLDLNKIGTREER